MNNLTLKELQRFYENNNISIGSELVKSIIKTLGINAENPDKIKELLEQLIEEKMKLIDSGKLSFSEQGSTEVEVYLLRDNLKVF